MTARIDLKIDGQIARLSLRSEDGENRIGADTIADLRAFAQAIHDDAEVRVVVVTGGAACFSRGWSRAYLAGALDGAELEPDPFGCLAALPRPVIACIQGQAVSAGLELALACDLRIAASGSSFAFNETEHGLIPLAGGTQRLPRLIGPGRARQMLLLGDVVDAETAHAWGLVNRVVAPAELARAVNQLAELIARRGPIAERFAKEAVNEGLELPLQRALRYELDLTVLLQTTEDRAEGVRAFAEKRPPEFHGR